MIFFVELDVEIDELLIEIFINGCRFLKQYLLLLVVHQAASALFRFIGAAGRNMIVANTFGLFALLLLFALGGFVLSRGMK